MCQVGAVLNTTWHNVPFVQLTAVHSTCTMKVSDKHTWPAVSLLARWLSIHRNIRITSILVPLPSQFYSYTSTDATGCVHSSISHPPIHFMVVSTTTLLATIFYIARHSLIRITLGRPHAQLQAHLLSTVLSDVLIQTVSPSFTTYYFVTLILCNQFTRQSQSSLFTPVIYHPTKYRPNRLLSGSM